MEHKCTNLVSIGVLLFCSSAVALHHFHLVITQLLYELVYYAYLCILPFQSPEIGNLVQWEHPKFKHCILYLCHAIVMVVVCGFYRAMLAQSTVMRG